MQRTSSHWKFEKKMILCTIKFTSSQELASHDADHYSWIGPTTYLQNGSSWTKSCWFPSFTRNGSNLVMLIEFYDMYAVIYKKTEIVVFSYSAMVHKSLVNMHPTLRKATQCLPEIHERKFILQVYFLKLLRGFQSVLVTCHFIKYCWFLPCAFHTSFAVHHGVCSLKKWMHKLVTSWYVCLALFFLQKWYLFCLISSSSFPRLKQRVTELGWTLSYALGTAELLAFKLTKGCVVCMLTYLASCWKITQCDQNIYGFFKNKTKTQTWKLDACSRRLSA